MIILLVSQFCTNVEIHSNVNWSYSILFQEELNTNLRFWAEWHMLYAEIKFLLEYICDIELYVINYLECAFILSFILSFSFSVTQTYTHIHSLTHCLLYPLRAFLSNAQ